MSLIIRLFIVLGLLYLIGLIQGVGSRKALNAREYITFDGETATVLKRNSAISEVLKVESIQKVEYKYNPAKVTYTGATVGGVTTGGFHTTNASYSEIPTGNSGRAYIKAKYPAKSPYLKEIILSTDELVESAKHNTTVSKFLKENKLILKYENEKTKLTDSENYVLREAISKGDQGLQYGITQRAYLEQQLTISDCNQIISWLSVN